MAIARALTDTFAGIRPMDLPGFVAAELIVAVAAMLAAGRLLAQTEAEPEAGGRP